MRIMTYTVSQLWRHPHQAMYGLYFSGVLALSMTVGFLNTAAGIAVLVELCLFGAWAISWRDVARCSAARRGYRVLYVMPSPTSWVAHRLRALGYTGAVAPHVWEMHVNVLKPPGDYEDKDFKRSKFKIPRCRARPITTPDTPESLRALTVRMCWIPPATHTLSPCDFSSRMAVI